MKLQKFLHQKYTPDEIENLEELNCNNSNISSIDGIEECINLKTLNCFCNNIKSFKGLNRNNNIKIINASYNKLKNINELKYCSKLHTLNISHNNLSNIDTLEENPLVFLNATTNNINTLNIRNFKKLNSLFIKRNNLPFIDDIEYLNKIVVLEFDVYNNKDCYNIIKNNESLDRINTYNKSSFLNKLKHRIIKEYLEKYIK